MAVNQLIARGLAPIGGDAPQIANMLQQMQQQKAQNALAQQEMGIRQQNADAYSGQLQAATAARQAEATKEQYGYAAQVGLALANAKTPDEFAMLADRVAADPQYQSIPGVFTREQMTPENVRATLPQVFAKAGMQMPQAPVPFEQTPEAAKIRMQGGQAMALERLRQRAPKATDAPAVATVRNLTPEELASAGYPAGTVVQAKADGSQRVMYKPPAVSTANDAKMRQQAATKIPQLTALTRRLDRLGTAVAAISDNPLFSGGVVSGKVLPYTKEGKELEASVSQVRPLLTALTRVPGIGSQSDLEARLDGLQYPQADLPAETNARNVEELALFIQDLQGAYQGLLQGGNAAPADDGWGIEEIE